jgi:hypothetical protein
MSLRMSSERKETSGLPRLSACRAYPCAFYLGALAQCHHVAHGRPPLDNGKHVGAPSIQGRALFAGEVVTLVDADDSGPASRDVIENLLRHLEAHAKPLEACCHRPAQIVQAPVCHTGLSVESRLGRRETVEGSAKARGRPARRIAALLAASLAPAQTAERYGLHRSWRGWQE